MKMKYILHSLALMLSVVISAQNEFVHIDWSRVQIQDSLPCFLRTIEVDDANALYEVEVLYPEFAQCSKQETDALNLMGKEIGQDLAVSTFLGISQKQPLLDVEIMPIVKRDGKYLKLTGCKLELKKTGSARAGEFVTDDERYKAHSVLSSGRWVKIRVKDEGIYQLSKSYLKSLGFNNPARVKLYGYGGRVQNAVISYGSYQTSDYDDLEEVPMYRRPDALLFWADGTTRWSAWQVTGGEISATHQQNTYSSYSYYFLTEGDDPLTIQELPSPTQTYHTLTTYPEHFLIDNDAFSWYTGGRTFFDSYDFANGNSKDYKIPTPDVDTETQALITVAFSAKSTSLTTARLTLGSQSLGTINLSAITSEYDKATVATKSFATQYLNNENTLNITTTKNTPARLDYIRVCYSRKLKMQGDFLQFSHYSAMPSKMVLEGADQNTQIWRIGYPKNPLARVNAVLDGKTMVFDVNNPTLRYVAVNVNAQYPQPQKVENIKNQDLHADSLYDMVIIYPESGKLLAQAQRLADFHAQHDTLKVKLVRADELYNEFSSGTPDAGAYRRYLKMLYDRNPQETAPKYLLLFGGCLWDNRGVTPACQRANMKDYLLCYESEPSVSEVSCYVNEDFFALLDDGEGSNLCYEKVDLGVGRLPVVKPEKAKILVDKIISYATNQYAGSWKNNVYFLADDGDKNKHVREADNVATRLEDYAPDMKVGKIYWDAYKRQITATGFTYPQVKNDLQTALTKGAVIVNYTGHGAPYTISKEQVLKVADFKSMQNQRLPMWVIASCEITPFDRQEENIGVEAMTNPQGGAIALLSSSRAVYSTQNNYINNYFMYYVLGKSNGRRNRLGDAMRLTKINLVSSVDGEIIESRDYSDNKLKYALTGDPALTLMIPTEKVVLDSINGVALKAFDFPNLSAGDLVRFSGHLEDAAGSLLSGFNGQLSATLYDSRDTVVCKNNMNEDVTPWTYYSYDRLLFEANDSVRAGKFQLTIPVPMDIKYSNGQGMLKLYAISSDRRLEANGTDHRFTIGGTSAQASESNQGPKLFVYLNNPDFQDGQTVNATPMFYANLQDSDGINITGYGVGHNLELIIDGKESTSYNLNPYYANDFGSFQRGNVQFLIPALPDGEHHLMFRAWDVKNNSSVAVLKFKVDTSLKPQITSLGLSNNPASTNTTFLISYDRPSEETTFLINVYNAMGQKCWTHRETAISSSGYHTIPWDLSSSAGAALPSGLYLCELTIETEQGQQAQKTQKLIISRQ